MNVSELKQNLSGWALLSALHAHDIAPRPSPEPTRQPSKELPDGWALLKIINTPDHPMNQKLRKTLRFTDRKIGEKFIQLKLKQYSPCYDSDDEESDDYRGVFDEQPAERVSLPGRQEVVDAYNDAIEELKMLKAANYKVEYFNEGLQQFLLRRPRIGDTVSIPVDLQTDLEQEEPLDPNQRMKFHNHHSDDRWYPNDRPNQLGFEPDEPIEQITLHDLVQDRFTEYSVIADRKQRLIWEYGLFKMHELGKIIINPTIKQRYNLSKDPTINELYRFIRWAYHTPHAEPWRWEWITKGFWIWQETA